jgi:hypothetical protein
VYTTTVGYSAPLFPIPITRRRRLTRVQRLSKVWQIYCSLYSSRVSVARWRYAAEDVYRPYIKSHIFFVHIFNMHFSRKRGSTSSIPTEVGNIYRNKTPNTIEYCTRFCSARRLYFLLQFPVGQTSECAARVQVVSKWFGFFKIPWAKIEALLRVQTYIRTFIVRICIDSCRFS